MIRLALLTILLAAQCAPLDAAPNLAPSGRVSIEGYRGDVMEPFLSRDGQKLFFNNRNDPPDATDLHWATRVSDLRFIYAGKVAGANSASLDGVPTASAQGEFCFISTRNYTSTLATIHCGVWARDAIESVRLQTDATPRIPGRVIFDIELSASGVYAIIADGHFAGDQIPAAADLRLARRGSDGALRLDPVSDAQLAAINSPALEYAAGLAADGLTMCFTRLEAGSPSLWIARRKQENAAFASPVQLSAITGFVEACTFAPDGAIYFHRLHDDRYELSRVEAPL